MDFAPGDGGLPPHPGRGQPKTLAAARQALTETRKYAAKLEGTARAQQIRDGKLRSKLTAVRDRGIAARSGLIKERDAVQDELEKTQQLTPTRDKELQEQAEGLALGLQKAQDEVAKLRSAFQGEKEEYAKLSTLHAQQADELRKMTVRAADRGTLRDHLSRQNGKLTERVAALRQQVNQAKDETNQQRSALQRANEELGELRTLHEQHAKEVDTLKEQAAAQVARLDELTKQQDGLRSRAETAEQTLAKRDDELKQLRENHAAVERAHAEVHLVAESGSRSLRRETEHRLATEQRLDQLSLKLAAHGGEVTPALLSDQHTQILSAELAQVRRHRDEVIAERELLSARILKLMAPGQYLEHAVAAGYDVTKDPLMQLKREELQVKDRYGAWQEANRKRQTARRLDPEQTLDEQAYAAMLAARFHRIDHPLKRRKDLPRWIILGILADAVTEQGLQDAAQARIERMNRKMQKACLPASGRKRRRGKKS